MDENLLLRNGKCLLLAYDQGFEHGPTDFDDDNVNPQSILDIALKANVFTGIVFQPGVAEKYYPVGGLNKKDYPPLVLKLNGKTAFHQGEEPLSLQLCDVDRAIRLGASAVGYTVYVGSEHEEEMLAQLGKIVSEAHVHNMPVVAWMYPRGKHVEGKENDKDTIAYAARLGLEIGADFVKIPYPGSVENLEWVVKSAGKTKVLVQGGGKKSTEEFLKDAQQIMQAGACGLAVGRNVWQADDPITISKKVSEIVFK
jgi:fructose-bisphosphate aldolase, class I